MTKRLFKFGDLVILWRLGYGSVEDFRPDNDGWAYLVKLKLPPDNPLTHGDHPSYPSANDAIWQIEELLSLVPVVDQLADLVR